MQKGLNPLYPESKGEGLMGEYEYAALIDDDKETFGKKRAGNGGAGKSGDVGKNGKSGVKLRDKYQDAEMQILAAERVRANSKEFNRQSDAIMAEYRAAMKKLRLQRREGRISWWEFQRRHRKLAARTNKALRRNWVKYFGWREK